MGRTSPRRSDYEVETRRGDVEQAMLAGRWDARTRASLMHRWEIGRVQLWRDYNAVLDAWVASIRLDVADPALDRLRALQRVALSNVIAFPAAARRLAARARKGSR